MSNGSHMIDLLIFLFGDILRVEILDPNYRDDGAPFQPDVKLYFQRGPMYLLVADKQEYDCFEFEVIGEKGAIRYYDGGHEIEIRLGHSAANYRSASLSKQATKIQSEMWRYQYWVVDALFNHLRSGQPICSNGATALQVVRVVDEIYNISRGLGRGN